MRRILLLILWQFGLLANSPLLADVVTLKDGRQIAGSVESGNIQELHIKVGDQSQTIDIDQVQAIQFKAASPPPAAAPPPKAADPAPAAAEPPAAQPNTLILNDGTRVPGRLWSIDATDLHLLVKNQLEHYPRRDVSGITFGSATLPPPPARSTPPSETSPQPPSGATPPPSAAQPPSATPPARATQPSRPPTPAASPSGAPPRPTLPRPSASTPPQAPARGLSQPDEVGMVYFWNGKVVIPLERNKATAQKSGATQYWEMAGAHSRVRLSEDSSLVFVIGLPEGVDPASYGLFPLDTVNDGRRTRPQSGRGSGPMTWPVDIVKKHESTISTYVFTVRDLPVGEYSFSPSNSNDGYCFGVDPAAPGQ